MQYSPEIINLLRNTLAKDGSLDLPSTGDSMFPYIKQGDVCRFTTCDPSRLKKGDIVLFWNLAGKLVAHRFHHYVKDKEEIFYVFKGDTNLGFDQPINKERILGKLLLIKRGKRRIYNENFVSILWGNIILSRPIFSGILRDYLDRK